MFSTEVYGVWLRACLSLVRDQRLLRPKGGPAYAFLAAMPEVAPLLPNTPLPTKAGSKESTKESSVTRVSQSLVCSVLYALSCRTSAPVPREGELCGPREVLTPEQDPRVALNACKCVGVWLSYLAQVPLPSSSFCERQHFLRHSR